MDEPTWAPLLDDYITTHQLSCTTGDVDVPQAMIRQVAHILNLTADQTAWLIMLYLAYDDIGSALLAYAATDGRPGAAPDDARHLPVGTNRRMHAKPALIDEHLRALVRSHRYLGTAKWLIGIAAARTDTAGRRHIGYRTALDGLMRVHGIGAWGAYRACTLGAAILADYNPAWGALEPDDMAVYYSGAIDAPLVLLTTAPSGAPHRRQISTRDSARNLGRLHQLTQQLIATLTDRGFQATPATCKTTLVQFRQMFKGRYYPGHDIDLAAARLKAADDILLGWDTLRPFDGSAAAVRRGHQLLEAAWHARAIAFPLSYLGEREQPPRLCVDRERARLYRDTGTIATRGAQSFTGILTPRPSIVDAVTQTADEWPRQYDLGHGIDQAQQIADVLTHTVLRPALADAQVTNPHHYRLTFDSTPIYQTTAQHELKIDNSPKDAR